eukprot:766858-Hanusia_phi.AAC.1
MQRRQGVRARSEEEKSSDQDQDDEEIIGVKYGDFVLVACEDRLPFIAFVCEPKAHMCKGTGSVKVMWLYRQDDVDPKALVRECKRLKCQVRTRCRSTDWLVYSHAISCWIPTGRSFGVFTWMNAR